MISSTVAGVVEQPPQVFAECPDYTSFGFRTDTGQYIEVFFDAQLVSQHPILFQVGRRLIGKGGEWYREPDGPGVGEYVRWWPASVRHVA